MKTVFLIYRPSVDYDDQMTPYFVVSSKSKAAKLLKEIKEWGKSVVEKFPEEVYQHQFMENSDDYGRDPGDDDKYYAAREKREKKFIKEAELIMPAPFIQVKDGILTDLEFCQDIYVEKMELNLL
jgi:hypothetical protein